MELGRLGSRLAGGSGMERLKQFIEEWNAPQEYIEAHTSGSTGTPKAIRLLKSDMKISALATNKFFGINEKSVVGMALSADYIAGKMMAVRSLLSGARLVALPSKTDVCLDGVDGVIDLFAIVPAQIQSFIDKPEYAAKVRNLLIGGAAPSAEQCHALTLLGYKAYISYGMTETCSHVALARADDSRRVFHAMPGIVFACEGPECRLVIECPHFSAKRIVTNDVAEILSPHKFRWRGRADNIINSGGIKLIPEELETMYAPFAGSVEYYVTSFAHDKWGRAVALVAATDCESLEAIAEKLRANIAEHKYLPKRLIAVKNLPKAGNGKIRRLDADSAELLEMAQL